MTYRRLKDYHWLDLCFSYFSKSILHLLECVFSVSTSGVFGLLIPAAPTVSDSREGKPGSNTKGGIWRTGKSDQEWKTAGLNPWTSWGIILHEQPLLECIWSAPENWEEKYSVGNTYCVVVFVWKKTCFIQIIMEQCHNCKEESTATVVDWLGDVDSWSVASKRLSSITEVNMRDEIMLLISVGKLGHRSSWSEKCRKVKRE